MSRLPLPFGWFQVASASDLGAGSVRPLEYFGAIWCSGGTLGESPPERCLLPHLGAHLGHGGTVDGDSIVCPFHGWQFDPDGRNTRIPYSARLNRSCSLGSYPLIERNGALMAWFHPDGDEPTWEIPEIPELSDPTGYSDPRTREFHVAAAWQEMAENGADSAHFGFVHGQDIVPTIDAFEIDGPILSMRSTPALADTRWCRGRVRRGDELRTGFQCRAYDRDHRHSEPGLQHAGLGGPLPPPFHVRRQTAGRPGDRQRRSATDSSSCSATRSARTPGSGSTRPILERPALSDQDGPIIQFRSWAQQFYARSN